MRYINFLLVINMMYAKYSICTLNQGLLRKLLKLRKNLLGLATTFQSFLGSTNEVTNKRQNMMDNAVSKLENFQSKISFMQKQLKDHRLCQFLIVTIPTKLSVLESQRLYNELEQQSIKVSDIVINQCLILDESDDDDDDANNDAKSKCVHLSLSKITNITLYVHALKKTKCLL